MSELEEDARTRLAHAVIIEFDAEDIGQVKDDLVFRVIGLGCRDVSLYAVDFLVCPLILRKVSSFGVPEIRLARNSPSGVPSWRTPKVDVVRSHITIHTTIHNSYRWCSVCRNSFVDGSDLDEEFTGLYTQVKYPYSIHDYQSTFRPSP
jgi:hypothetical protein